MRHEKWEIHDRCELISTSFEDSGHYHGDTGRVIGVNEGKCGTDIRVVWDSGAETCWIPAEDCSK